MSSVMNFVKGDFYDHELRWYQNFGMSAKRIRTQDRQTLQEEVVSVDFLQQSQVNHDFIQLLQTLQDTHDWQWN
ncbi:hypothetical protein INT47_005844 [Mucor saturninus]|uniref:Uncharacterized protein n=1 Tax=Mucor saturninus TaxID=64648 RepID=A0A8H7QXW8_9FUNG|nr:hypothetical protein INT47_005844 [Mucor saturninus]